MPQPPHPDHPVAGLRAVHVAFAGREALCHIDLDISRGSVTVFVGPNGAGKSTLLEVIAGTRHPSSGTRTTDGAIAFVPQRTAVSDRLPVTVRDMVAVGTWGRDSSGRRSRGRARTAIDHALEALHITPLAGQPFATLSGGQRQRTLLAQGLARGADLLLLDEPTTGLDAESAERIRAVVRAEAERGAAVVCVTHDPLVIMTADRVVRLGEGRIEA